MIEGGLGGTVNLRTFMPFDFQGQKIAASVSENYGDGVEKYEPPASVLYSNRWHTSIGDMGFLVDVADSRLSTRTDGLFVRPFFENAGGTWVPRGADWRTLLYDRKRDGTYLAFQWRPNDDLDFHATAFQSKYHEVWHEDAIFVSNDPTQVMVDASQPSVINGGVFQSGRLTQNGGMPMGTDIRASNSHSKTTDFSTGMKWRLGEGTEFTSALQFVKATTNGLDSTVSLGTNVPYIDVALNGNKPPRIGVDSDFTGNPANYYWGFTMDHQDQNYARELAWRADISHSFVDGFVQGVKGGVRLTNRYADNIDTGYNWMPVFQTWMQGWALPVAQYLKTAWADIRARLLDGSYRPSAVRRVGIPKPGGGQRELGIPTVVDRLIQQALLQVLQPIIDPSFSEHSHGFRPGRSAHGAVMKAQQY